MERENEETKKKQRTLPSALTIRKFRDDVEAAVPTVCNRPASTTRARTLRGTIIGLDSACEWTDTVVRALDHAEETGTLDPERDLVE